LPGPSVEAVWQVIFASSSAASRAAALIAASCDVHRILFGRLMVFVDDLLGWLPGWCLDRLGRRADRAGYAACFARPLALSSYR
jgi:hypothetical protein